MRTILVLLLSVASAASAPPTTPTQRLLQWEQLPALPDREGFAAPFVGTSGGALLVAGGANFPDLKPWEGGSKIWHDTIFVLERPEGSWNIAGKLPRPLAYGLGVTTPDGLLCIGGSDAQRHYTDCFLVQWHDGALSTTPMPALPQPCANMTGALLNRMIYVAGGTTTPTDTTASRIFWALDLDRPDAGWTELEPWPGPARMLAVAAAQSGAFFLASGAELHPDAQGNPSRTYLQDAYRFTPGSGWIRIADLPHPVVAAPSPAPAVGQSHFLVLGGDDGALAAFEPKSAHPGFPNRPLAYHTITDTWTELSPLPASRVTVPTVEWRGRTVVPSGEARPGVRSPEVWGFKVASTRANFGWLNYATLSAYLAAMVGMGAWFMRRQKSTDDYFKGGGRVPWWAAGLSIYATMLSSISFMAIPAKAFAADWTFFWANVPILLLAPVIVHVYLPFFRQLNVTSAYEYLEKRFNLAARLYGSAAFVLFQLGRQAIVLFLPSLAMAAVTDLNIHTCILLMGLLCVVYTTMGGIEAVIWTDVVQSVVLLGVALLSLVVIIGSTHGGLAGIWKSATEAGKLHTFNWTLDWRTTANAFWVILVGNLFIVLIPYTSDQTVVQRYMTTPNQTKAARSIWTNALLSIPSTAFFFAIGTALWVFYKSNPEGLNPALGTDAIFPTFIINAMPAGVAGLAIAGIFAAAQSTVSSGLNSVSTAIVTDFVRRFRPRIAERSALRLARGLTVGIGILATGGALLLATFQIRSLWDTYNTLVGLTGSGLAGLFLLGIASRRANGTGAIAGVVASAGLLWWAQTRTDMHFFLYAGLGITTCVVTGYLVSLLCPDRTRNLAGLTIHTRQKTHALLGRTSGSDGGAQG